jgi:hypothetical protein
MAKPVFAGGFVKWLFAGERFPAALDSDLSALQDVWQFSFITETFLICIH